jgi:DNA polymerase-3 subunit epsilon
VVVDEFVSLIQPPNNVYSFTIKVHGIYPRDTVNAKRLLKHKSKKRLQNKIVAAHNESFDRTVLSKAMVLHGLHYEDLNIAVKWECTVRIYKAKGLNQLN